MKSKLSLKRKYFFYSISGIIFLAGILFFGGCVDSVFKTPQPKGFVNLEEFPKELQGNYISIPSFGIPKTDSIAITIENRIFTTTIYQWEKITKPDNGQIDLKKSRKPSASAFEIKTYSYYEKADTFYFLEKTIKYHPLGKDFILRKMGENYFLNFADTIETTTNKHLVYWCVFKLNLSTDEMLSMDLGTLMYHHDPKKKIEYDSLGNEIYMMPDQAKNYFSKITPIHSLPHNYNATCYLFDPDSTQLKKLIDKGFFVDTFVFKKLNRKLK
jgi:hypothetical protein